MPGFVDCHTHLMFPPPQPAGSDAPNNIEHAARSLNSVTAQRLAGRGRAYLQTMAMHGTTTLEAKSGCGPDQNAQMKVLRVLKVLNQGALDIVPTFLFRLGSHHGDRQHEDNEAAELVFRDLMFKIRRRRLARFADLQWDTDAARRPLLVPFTERGSLALAFRAQDPRRPAEFGGRGFAGGATWCYQHRSSGACNARPGAFAGGIPHDRNAIALRLVFPRGYHAPARMLMEFGAAVALGSNFNPYLSPPLDIPDGDFSGLFARR